MDVEQRFFKLHGIQFPVEIFIVFILKIRGLFGPSRIWVVDNIVYRYLFFFGIVSFTHFLGFFTGAKFDRYGHEFVILGKEVANSAVFQKFFILIVNVKDNLRTSFGFVVWFQGEFRRTCAGPMNSGFVFIGFGYDLHFIGHHKRRIETEPEMTYNTGVLSRIFIFFQELTCARKSNFIDIFFYFFGGHSNPLVYNVKFLALFVNFHFNNGIAIFYFGFTNTR